MPWWHRSSKWRICCRGDLDSGLTHKWRVRKGFALSVFLHRFEALLHDQAPSFAERLVSAQRGMDWLLKDEDPLAGTQMMNLCSTTSLPTASLPTLSMPTTSMPSSTRSGKEPVRGVVDLGRSGNCPPNDDMAINKDDAAWLKRTAHSMAASRRGKGRGG